MHASAKNPAGGRVYKLQFSARKVKQGCAGKQPSLHVRLPSTLTSVANLELVLRLTREAGGRPWASCPSTPRQSIPPPSFRALRGEHRKSTRLVVRPTSL